MAVQELKNVAEFDEALANEVVIVDFYATWCGPCKMIAPMVEKFSEQYSSFKFYKVDVDEASDIAQKYSVSSLPTIKFFKGGKEVSQIVGANPTALKQTLASL